MIFQLIDTSSAKLNIINKYNLPRTHEISHNEEKNRRIGEGVLAEKTERGGKNRKKKKSKQENWEFPFLKSNWIFRKMFI